LPVRKRGVLMYLHEDKAVFKQMIQQVAEMSGNTEEFVEKDYYVKEIDIVIEHDGVLNPIEIKKTSNPGSELIKVFELLDRSSTPREKGAVLCMKPELSAIDRDNYIVPIWMI